VTGLNDSQRRHVASRFGYVDRLLQDVDRLTRDDPSPFAAERADVQDDEARFVRGFVAQARSRMIAALDRLKVPRPRPTTSARWSIETDLRFAAIALGELGAEDLAAYGEVDPAAGAEVGALAADLKEVMSRGVALLHERDPGRLRERIAEVPGAAGEILRALERRSAEEGLTEVRPLLEAAVDRALDSALTLGVFGRVGVGKSSLINALAGVEVLPVGAVPVTAVPLRISHGPAGAVVHFLGGASEPVALERIPEFATENGNPDNQRGVRSLDVALPSLPADLRLLDTPGVGSLAASGATAVASLPRCDLGLILIQAGAPLGREELALLRGLGYAGVAHLILVSKADLLPPDDRRQVVAYLTRAVTEAVGPDAAAQAQIHLTSSAPAAATLLTQFRQDVIAPLMRDHARAARAALRARLHRLVAATAGARAGRQGALTGALVDVQRRRLEAHDAIGRITDRLESEAPAALQSGCAAVLAAWGSGRDPEAGVRRALADPPARALAAVRGAVDRVRGRNGEGSDPATSRLPPVFEPALPAVALTPPRGLAAALGRSRAAARALAPLTAPTARAFADYAERLRTWGLATLDDVAAGAAAESSPLPDGEALDEELARLDGLIDPALPV